MAVNFQFWLLFKTFLQIHFKIKGQGDDLFYDPHYLQLFMANIDLWLANTFSTSCQEPLHG